MVVVMVAWLLGLNGQSTFSYQTYVNDVGVWLLVVV